MKICLLNDAFPPVIDGVVNVVQNYAHYLMTQHDAEVIVGTPEYPGGTYDAYPYPVVAYPSINTSSITNGYRTGYPFTSKPLERLAAFGPDLIHAHSPASAALTARLLREETAAPLVYTYHTKYDIDIRRAVKLRLAANEGIRMMISNIEAFDEVWVVSEGAGENLRELGFSGDYRVMHNGVDFAKGRVAEQVVSAVTGKYDLPANVPVFLYVGRLMNYKGLPMLLDALKRLADTGTDFRMVFIGKGPDRQFLEEKAKELGLLGRRCLFPGAVYDRDELRAWNTRADVFLFPSTFDTNGLVVREAAACVLPSVLIEGSCAAEGITDGENGFLVKETAEDVARRLSVLSRNLPLLRKTGEHAMDEIYLSWETCVAEAYERYQFLVEEKACGRLPEKKKNPADLLLSFTAKGMHERERFRAFGRELFADVRESAAGMMENVQESASDLAGSVQESASGMMENAREGAAEVKEELRQVREEAQQIKEKMKNFFQ